MATILNIETSAQMCSVAISQDGAIIHRLSEQEGMNHAKALAPFNWSLNVGNYGSGRNV